MGATLFDGPAAAAPTKRGKRPSLAERTGVDGPPTGPPPEVRECLAALAAVEPEGGEPLRWVVSVALWRLDGPGLARVAAAVRAELLGRAA